MHRWSVSWHCQLSIREPRMSMHLVSYLHVYLGNVLEVLCNSFTRKSCGLVIVLCGTWVQTWHCPDML